MPTLDWLNHAEALTLSDNVPHSAARCGVWRALPETISIRQQKQMEGKDG